MQHTVITNVVGRPIKVDTPEGEMALLVGFKPREATRALELLGKELGIFVERRERGRPGDFAGLSDAELEAKLVQTLVDRGLPEEQARALYSPRRVRIGGTA